MPLNLTGGIPMIEELIPVITRRRHHRNHHRMIPRHSMGILGGLALLAAPAARAEDVTVTTYYPSPQGVFEELRTTQDTSLAIQGGDRKSTRLNSSHSSISYAVFCF